MGKIIGFCGAGGTGKTTTAKALAAALPGHVLLPSASREVFKRFGIANEDAQKSMTPAERWFLQKSIQIAHLENFRAASYAETNWVSDRTQLDQLCYAFIQCAEALEPADLDWLDNLIKETLPLYSAIVYFPLHTFEGQSDGMRTNSLAMRTKFDLILQSLLRKYLSPHIPFFGVPIAPVDERVQWIKDSLENLGGI